MVALLKKKVAFDLYAYLAFIASYFIAYKAVLFQQKPFWAINLIPIPTLNSRFYIPGQFYWFPGNLGSPAQPNIAYWLQYIFVQLSGGNIAWAEKLIVLAPLVSCFTMYYFLSKHFGGSRLACFAAALIFGLGPATVLDFSDFLLWGFVAIPIVFNYTFNIINSERKITDILLLGLSLSFLTAFLPQILPLILISIIILIFINLLPVAKKLNYFLKVLVFFSLSFLVFVLTSPYLLSGTYHLLVTIGWAPPSGIITLSSLPSQSQPSLYFATYANQAIVNTIRLIGGAPGNYLAESNWLGFILPILAFASILLVPKGKKFLNLLALAIISLITITIIYGIHLHADWAMWLLYNTPISLFYYPERPLYVVTFAFCVMVCVTTERLLNFNYNYRFKNYFRSTPHILGLNWQKIFSILIVALLLASVFLFAPVFDQNLQQERYHQLPSFYFNIQNWLNSQGNSENYRVMFLPTDAFSTILGDPDVFEYTPGYVSYITQSYVDFVYNQLVNNATYNLGSLLAPASVKYIIVATPDPSTLWNGTAALSPPIDASDLSGPLRYTDGEVQGNPVYLEQVLDKQTDLKLVYVTNDFRVYENMMFLPKISVFSSATYVVGTEDIPSILPQMLNFNADTDLLIFASQNHNLTQELSSVSSSILFFNADLSDYAHLLASTTENAASAIGLKDQVYIFSENSSSFSDSITLPSGQWRIALEEPVANYTQNSDLNVDGENVSSAKTVETNGWRVFGPLNLTFGVHTISISNGIAGEYFAIYNTENLSQIFDINANINYNFSESSETSYRLDVNANIPVFISLSESFYPNWIASSEGKNLLHFAAFSYSNGFYLNNSDAQITTISYEPPILNQIYVVQQVLFGGIMLSLFAILVVRVKRSKLFRKKVKNNAI